MDKKPEFSSIPFVSINETSKETEILVNGKKVDGVLAYRIEHKAGKLPVLFLELVGCNMEINQRMIPALPEVFQGFYQHIQFDDSKSIQ